MILTVHNPRQIVVVDIGDYQSFKLKILLDGRPQNEYNIVDQDDRVIIEELSQYCKGGFAGRVGEFAPFALEQLYEELTRFGGMQRKEHSIRVDDLFNQSSECWKKLTQSWSTQELRDAITQVIPKDDDYKGRFGPLATAKEKAFQAFSNGDRSVQPESIIFRGSDWNLWSGCPECQRKEFKLVRKYCETLHSPNEWRQIIANCTNVILDFWWSRPL